MRAGLTVYKLRPVAHIERGIKEETIRTGHEDGVVTNTLVVETTVCGVRNKH